MRNILAGSHTEHCWRCYYMWIIQEQLQPQNVLWKHKLIHSQKNLVTLFFINYYFLKDFYVVLFCYFSCNLGVWLLVHWTLWTRFHFVFHSYQPKPLNNSQIIPKDQLLNPSEFLPNVREIKSPIIVASHTSPRRYTHLSVFLFASLWCSPTCKWGIIQPNLTIFKIWKEKNLEQPSTV